MAELASNTRTCRVPGCTRGIESRGICAAHASRIRAGQKEFEQYRLPSRTAPKHGDAVRRSGCNRNPLVRVDLTSLSAKQVRDLLTMKERRDKAAAELLAVDAEIQKLLTPAAE